MVFIAVCAGLDAQPKAVFIILDGISADVLEKVETPALDAIAATGGYTRAYTGGIKGAYSQSPTISAPGYNHVLTGVWSYKHNVWDNSIKAPNYRYRNIFRIVKEIRPQLKTAIFSTWLDNRTKLIGEGLAAAGNIKLDYAFDGFELNEELFPHDKDKRYIYQIDEYVSAEAARYIREHSPDLSWVYLEYTDDVGHRYGDSPEYEEAIRLADRQVERIWDAVQHRQQNYGENWMIVVTTDHGRDAETGKHHGAQSERERTVWIITNAKDLNQHFGNETAAVDIMPSLLRHLQIDLPAEISYELDGVPFIGPLSVYGVNASMDQNQKIHLKWTAFDTTEKFEIWTSVTDHYKSGGSDRWTQIKTCSTGNCTVDAKKLNTSVYKIVVKGKHNASGTRILIGD